MPVGVIAGVDALLESIKLGTRYPEMTGLSGLDSYRFWRTAFSSLAEI